MSNALQAIAVMIGILFAPGGMTEFSVSQAQDDGSSKKIFAVLLHDGFWRVTSSDNPQGTDYRIQEKNFIMRNHVGRQFPSPIDKDIDWSSIDFSAPTANAPFRHSSMGEPLEISRGIPGASSDPSMDRFLTVLQKSGWVRGFLFTYSQTKDTNETK